MSISVSKLIRYAFRYSEIHNVKMLFAIESVGF